MVTGCSTSLAHVEISLSLSGCLSFSTHDGRSPPPPPQPTASCVLTPHIRANVHQGLPASNSADLVSQSRFLLLFCPLGLV